MTLRAFVEDVTAGSRTITVFAPERDEAFARHFESRGVTVEHERLPDDGSGGFVVVTEDGKFVGSVPRRVTHELVSPGASDLELGSGTDVRLPMNLLADTTFVAFDRQQMLATSREIEDRAYRRGRGTLRAGFQSLSTLEPQRDVYGQLTRDTDLDVHLYGEHDWDPGLPDATVHAQTADELGRFWFIVFDGGGDDRQACALLAEEVADESESFRGFWTYEPGRVAELDAYLAGTY
ncbi:DICT sensory domain-containing protein [Halorussus halobius]|uniref:DICT sensory domain-containing protein n=1 Tax=Halorussus halobius TaxID=1710537 RepID=UPI001092AB2D|nr:DICT sensory domain-containing protein [Halorussus halobius]